MISQFDNPNQFFRKKEVLYQKIGLNFTSNLLAYLFLMLGQENKSMGGSFIAILDQIFLICRPTMQWILAHFVCSFSLENLTTFD